MNVSVKTVLKTIIVIFLIDCHKVLLSVLLKGEREADRKILVPVMEIIIFVAVGREKDGGKTRKGNEASLASGQSVFSNRKIIKLNFYLRDCNRFHSGQLMGTKFSELRNYTADSNAVGKDNIIVSVTAVEKIQ